LSLGSNLEDRLKNLARAIRGLAANHIEVIKISSVYESEPYGVRNQPWFLNMVIQIDTKLTPLQLFQRTQQVEKQVGRKKTFHWGPRIIDIDILSYYNLILRHPMLDIPHRQLHLRQFVLIPLKEIAASFVHPKFDKTIDQLINECEDNALVNWFMDGTKILTYLS